MNNSGEDFHTLVMAGARLGVAAALREHIRLGMPIYVERDGKIIDLPPEEVPEEVLYPQIEGFEHLCKSPPTEAGRQ